MITLRAAAAELLRIGGEIREVARRLEVNGAHAETWAIGRDVDAVAFAVERYAAVAQRAADRLPEPETGTEEWPRGAAPRELQEIGR